MMIPNKARTLEMEIASPKQEKTDERSGELT
jgi:hypothetical protein